MAGWTFTWITALVSGGSRPHAAANWLVVMMPNLGLASSGNMLVQDVSSRADSTSGRPRAQRGAGQVVMG